MTDIKHNLTLFSTNEVEVQDSAGLQSYLDLFENEGSLWSLWSRRGDRTFVSLSSDQFWPYPAAPLEGPPEHRGMSSHLGRLAEQVGPERMQQEFWKDWSKTAWSDMPWDDRSYIHDWLEFQLTHVARFLMPEQTLQARSITVDFDTGKQGLYGNVLQGEAIAVDTTTLKDVQISLDSIYGKMEQAFGRRMGDTMDPRDSQAFGDVLDEALYSSRAPNTDPKP